MENKLTELIKQQAVYNYKQLHAHQIDLEKELSGGLYYTKDSNNTITSVGTTTTNINPSQHIGYWQVNPLNTGGILNQINSKKRFL